jgi:hypothetical protein
MPGVCRGISTEVKTDQILKHLQPLFRLVPAYSERRFEENGQFVSKVSKRREVTFLQESANEEWDTKLSSGTEGPPAYRRE